VQRRSCFGYAYCTTTAARPSSPTSLHMCSRYMHACLCTPHISMSACESVITLGQIWRKLILSIPTFRIGATLSKDSTRNPAFLPGRDGRYLLYVAISAVPPSITRPRPPIHPSVHPSAFDNLKKNQKNQKKNPMRRDSPIPGGLWRKVQYSTVQHSTAQHSACVMHAWVRGHSLVVLVLVFFYAYVGARSRQDLHI